MSGARSGGVPEASEMRWLALVVLLGIVGLAVWFAARWLIVLPLLVWAYFNYALLDALGMLDLQGVAWRQFAVSAWDAIMSGRMSSSDLEWGTHLHPLHREVSARTTLLWLPLLVVAALFVLFRSRGGGFRRTFLLTGLRKQGVTRLFGMRLGGGLLGRLVRLLAAITFTRKLILTERKEWQSAGPSFLAYQGMHWKTSSVAMKFRQDGSNIPAPSMTPAEWVLECVGASDGVQRLSLDQFLAACTKAMLPQLGKPWQGLRRAPAYIQCLAALAYVNRTKGEGASRNFAERLTGIFLANMNAEKRERAMKAAADSVLRDAKAQSRLDGWAANHAWTNTAMIAIMAKGGPFQEWGGGDAGVLPTSSFLWLKDVDRHLWYALNNIGRRAFQVEGAGAVCHFFHERIAERPLEEPVFEEAILGHSGQDGARQERIHGILGYLVDNAMIADKNNIVVDMALIRSVLRPMVDA